MISKGSLPGFKLGFTVHSVGWNAGAADVVESAGDRVWGVVFELTDEDLRALDRYEGYPDQYLRLIARIDTPAGGLDAWVYSARQKHEFVPPRRRYVEIIKNAAVRYCFPEPYMRMLDEVRVVDG